MISEWLKLLFFVLGLICLGLAVVKSVYCLASAAVCWSVVHLIHGFMSGYPMDRYFDNLDPAKFFDYD